MIVVSSKEIREIIKLKHPRAECIRDIKRHGNWHGTNVKRQRNDVYISYFVSNSVLKKGLYIGNHLKFSPKFSEPARFKIIYIQCKNEQYLWRWVPWPGWFDMEWPS